MLFYRDKLPKFNNNGKMIFSCMEWVKDMKEEKIHPTQKPISVLSNLISIFTDEGDIVIDPVAGSASTLIAAYGINRKSFGFEIKKDFYDKAMKRIEEARANPMLWKFEKKRGDKYISRPQGVLF